MENPHPFNAVKVFTLANSVSAIQALPGENGEFTRLGLITQLPEGAEIQLKGAGFNDLTRSIRCFGSIYFVFVDDLEQLGALAIPAHA